MVAVLGVNTHSNTVSGQPNSVFNEFMAGCFIKNLVGAAVHFPAKLSDQSFNWHMLPRVFASYVLA